MKFSTFKFKGFLSILILVFLLSCENDEFNINPPFEISKEFQFQTEKTFCQQNPENEISSKSFKYDTNGNIIETIASYNGVPELKSASTYNNNNQQLTDSTFYFRAKHWEYESSRQFVYSRNLLAEILEYDSSGKNTHKTVYNYKGTKPRWEEFYYNFGDQWQFQYAHGFEFDKNGNLTKKSSYQTEEKDKIYDQFIYGYKNNRLVEEKRIILTGETSYVNKFSYTPEGFLDETIKDGKVVEKNFYGNGKLIEKRTFYFGIDPGFSACYGNFIFRYSY
jgi:hypothetical protein